MMIESEKVKDFFHGLGFDDKEVQAFMEIMVDDTLDVREIRKPEYAISGIQEVIEATIVLQRTTCFASMVTAAAVIMPMLNF